MGTLLQTMYGALHIIADVSVIFTQTKHKFVVLISVIEARDTFIKDQIEKINF